MTSPHGLHTNITLPVQVERPMQTLGTSLWIAHDSIVYFLNKPQRRQTAICDFSKQHNVAARQSSGNIFLAAAPAD